MSRIPGFAEAHGMRQLPSIRHDQRDRVARELIGFTLLRATLAGRATKRVAKNRGDR